VSSTPNDAAKESVSDEPAQDSKYEPQLSTSSSQQQQQTNRKQSDELSATAEAMNDLIYESHRSISNDDDGNDTKNDDDLDQSEFVATAEAAADEAATEPPNTNSWYDSESRESIQPNYSYQSYAPADAFNETENLTNDDERYQWQQQQQHQQAGNYFENVEGQHDEHFNENSNQQQQYARASFSC